MKHEAPKMLPFITKLFFCGGKPHKKRLQTYMTSEFTAQIKKLPKNENTSYSPCHLTSARH